MPDLLTNEEMKQQFQRIAKLRTLFFGEFLEEMAEQYPALRKHRNSTQHKDPYYCQVCSQAIPDSHERLVYIQKSRVPNDEPKRTMPATRIKRQRR